MSTVKTPYGAADVSVRGHGLGDWMATIGFVTGLGATKVESVRQLVHAIDSIPEEERDRKLLRARRSAR